jgi:hypothetical protein
MEIFPVQPTESVQPSAPVVLPVQNRAQLRWQHQPSGHTFFWIGVDQLTTHPYFQGHPITNIINIIILIYFFITILIVYSNENATIVIV